MTRKAIISRQLCKGPNMAGQSPACKARSLDMSLQTLHGSFLIPRQSDRNSRVAAAHCNHCPVQNKRHYSYCGLRITKSWLILDLAAEASLHTVETWRVPPEQSSQADHALNPLVSSSWFFCLRHTSHAKNSAGHLSYRVRNCVNCHSQLLLNAKATPQFVHAVEKHAVVPRRLKLASPSHRLTCEQRWVLANTECHGTRGFGCKAAIRGLIQSSNSTLPGQRPKDFGLQ